MQILAYFVLAGENEEFLPLFFLLDKTIRVHVLHFGTCFCKRFTEVFVYKASCIFHRNPYILCRKSYTLAKRTGFAIQFIRFSHQNMKQLTKIQQKLITATHLLSRGRQLVSICYIPAKHISLLKHKCLTRQAPF